MNGRAAHPVTRMQWRDVVRRIEAGENRHAEERVILDAPPAHDEANRFVRVTFRLVPGGSGA